MPTGPKGQKRPRDPNQLAKLIVDIAHRPGRGPGANARGTGDASAIVLGRKGGKSRAEKMTPTQRVEIARRAAASRWKTKGR
jgi:hypothetical protein